MKRSKTKCRRSRDRKGIAVAELAACLPVIVLLIFASLDGSSALFLRQATIQAAYEAAKASAKSRGSQAQGEQLAREVLAARRVTPNRIVFNPGNVDALPAGTPFTVTVAVPSNARAISGIGPFGDLEITAQATMQKE